MNIELPQTRPYDGLFVLGSRLDDGGGAEEIGAIIVKAAYLLTPSGGTDTHEMVIDPDPDASTLLLEDKGEADPDGFVVTRETDLAPYKPVPDIAVEHFLDGLDGGGAEVEVDDTTWLTRSLGLTPPDLVVPFHRRDGNLHLFGYHPRSLGPRASEAGTPPLDSSVPVPTLPTFPPRETTLLGDIIGYQNRFLNFHRRGDGFTAAAAVSGALLAGQRITVRKAGADAFSVTLTHPPLTALYRTWCGHGPDRAPFWTRVRLGAMRADTLILNPDQGRAEIIWRAVWRWADAPKNSYRAVRVSEEGI